MLSHVVNITLHTVRITWCKIWQQCGWQLLYWNAEGCTSYVCHISISKVQIYTLLYVGYWLKETVSKCSITVLRIWLISQYLAAHFSHCKAMIDNMVHNSDLFHLICTYVLGLFCFFLCFASVHFHHASLLLFFLSAVDPDRFLDVHPLSEFVTLVLSSDYTCFPTEDSWDAPLSYFRELVYNWLIYILFISESQDSLAQFMANLQKV